MIWFNFLAEKVYFFIPKMVGEVKVSWQFKQNANEGMGFPETYYKFFIFYAIISENGLFVSNSRIQSFFTFWAIMTDAMVDKFNF